VPPITDHSVALSCNALEPLAQMVGVADLHTSACNNKDILQKLPLATSLPAATSTRLHSHTRSSVRPGRLCPVPVAAAPASVTQPARKAKREQ
jgi:hypothetical protein